MIERAAWLLHTHHAMSIATANASERFVIVSALVDKLNDERSRVTSGEREDAEDAEALKRMKRINRSCVASIFDLSVESLVFIIINAYTVKSLS